uniref:GST N-terminal domain-containing protein n=1 Tax=Graphocephala atropunctata TaxID=36148 RepID=A0A1B6M7Z1_9HEMI
MSSLFSSLCFVLTCSLHLGSFRTVYTAAAYMAGKHLSTGSTDPPLVAGKLRLYSMRFCPYSHRAHLVLLAKNISYDPVFINLRSKPDWYTNTVPSGKVPALLVDSQIVSDSLIITDYLDEKYSQRPLHSKDPLQKAKDRILIENFGKVTSPFYKVMTGVNATVEEFEDVVKELVAFDNELASRGTPFFGGDKPGMVDYVIWPWFERIQMFKILHGDQFVFPKDRLPNLAQWLTRMVADEAVQQYYLTPEKHASFIRTQQSGNPDYDILTRG